MHNNYWIIYDNKVIDVSYNWSGNNIFFYNKKCLFFVASDIILI